MKRDIVSDHIGAVVTEDRGELHDYVADRALEKKLLRKFDIHILPLLYAIQLAINLRTQYADQISTEHSCTFSSMAKLSLSGKWADRIII